MSRNNGIGPRSATSQGSSRSLCAPSTPHPARTGRVPPNCPGARTVQGLHCSPWCDQRHPDYIGKRAAGA